VELLMEALRDLRAVKVNALKTLNDGLPTGAQRFEACEMAIPQIDQLIAELERV
jgi:hypothetical protein